MGSQQYKLNGFVRCCGTIGTGNKFSVSLFSICSTKKHRGQVSTFDILSVTESMIWSSKNVGGHGLGGRSLLFNFLGSSVLDGAVIGYLLSVIRGKLGDIVD